MTVDDLFQAAVRRWYVVLIGVLLTLASIQHVRSAPVVYYSKVTAVVLSPADDEVDQGNSLLIRGPVPLASLVVMDVNNQPNKVRASSDDATLYAMGYRSATWIHLQQAGNQWKATAAGPNIEIEAVDSTPEAVEDRTRTAMSEIGRALQKHQDDFHIKRADRAWIEQSPASPVILPYGASRGRAQGATLLLGICLTAVAVVLADRLLGAVGRRRARAGVPAQDDDLEPPGPMVTVPPAGEEES